MTRSGRQATEDEAKRLQSQEHSPIEVEHAETVHIQTEEIVRDATALAHVTDGLMAVSSLIILW